MAMPKKLQHTVIYVIDIIIYLINIMADLLEDKMNLNSILKNALNVIINIFTGWLTFWIFFYSWFFITDRKDAEAESFVPVGLCYAYNWYTCNNYFSCNTVDKKRK